MWEAGSPAGELDVGQSLGPYRLEELLGEGGMGLVFRAVREPDGEVVALKVRRGGGAEGQARPQAGWRCVTATSRVR